MFGFFRNRTRRGFFRNFTFHSHGGEADVVGVFQGADPPATVESDVEFPRQAVHLPMVEDVVMHPPGEIARVDQFLRIDPGGGRGGDVADVIRPGASVDDAQLVQAHEHIGRVLGADFANLQIRAGGNIRISAAEFLGQIRDAAELRRCADPAGESQAAHERILGRRDIEHPLELHQEHVRPFGESSVAGVIQHKVPRIQSVHISLRLLFGAELLARCDETILRRDPRIGRHRWRC